MFGRTESRQLPGFACEDCRKKKLRCDRQRPQCGGCITAGIHCRVNDRRLPRTQNKGLVEALKGRVDDLESQLARVQTQTTSNPVANQAPILDFVDFEVINWDPLHESRQSDPLSASGTRSTNEEGFDVSPLSSTSHGRHNPLDHSISESSMMDNHSGLDSEAMSEAMKADLTQIFFERVYPMVPVLHRGRYFQSAEMPHDNGRECLELAMWTLATTFSSQFGNNMNNMYSKTLERLVSLDLEQTDTDCCHIEEIQAWILLTLFELSKCSYRRAWLSSAHVFRLIQIARLYELDKGTKESDTIELEEMRRTFWVAYCMDRFFSISSCTPVMLPREKIRVRLPSTDQDFEKGELPGGPFLSEVIANGDPRELSYFAECCIVLAIYDKAGNFDDAAVAQPQPDLSLDAGFQNDWLNYLLTNRLKNIERRYSEPSSSSEPMTIFIRLLVRATILCFPQTTSSSRHVDAPTYSVTGNEKYGVIRAAHEIARLGSTLERLGLFRAHTFTALPIYLSASKLRSWSMEIQGQCQTLSSSRDETSNEFELSFQSCLSVLRKLQTFDKLATYYLTKLS